MSIADMSTEPDQLEWFAGAPEVLMDGVIDFDWFLCSRRATTCANRRNMRRRFLISGHCRLRKDHASMRRSLLFVLKAAVSILLLYLALRSVNLGAALERLSRIKTIWMAASFLILAVQISLGALRWRTIVTFCDVKLPLVTAVRISFISSFFGQVLPSTVGGDAVRIWLLARNGGGWARATYSVLIDRIVGVFVLALLVIGCLPWTVSIIHDPIALTVLLLIGFGAVAGAVVFMATGLLEWRLLDRWAPTRHLVEASRVAWRLCGSSSATLLVTMLSFSIHLLTVAAVWCAAQSVAASVSFAQLLFLLPPVILIATVPISIAGWGVRESSMIIAFAYAGLAQSDGLIVSILIGLATFAIGAAGGAVWIASDGKRTRASEVKPLTDDT